ELQAGRVELRERLRGRADARRAVLVGAVDDRARPGVVRDGVEPAVVRARRGEAREPRPRVRVIGAVERGERARGAVLRDVCVAELDHVRVAAARESGLELRLVVAPALILDV